MAFKDLKNEELAEVADFFIVDVVAANPDKPTKKEFLAALASGDEPVTWEQYEDIYLVAKSANQVKSKEVLAQEAEAERLAAEEAELEAEEAAKPETPKKPVRDTSKDIPVKYERNNPRYDVAGLTFTKAHPFAVVDPDTAEWLIKNVPGIRLALPSEVADYYGAPR